MADLSLSHLESFLEMMSAERGAAANTLAAYRRDLEDVHHHLQRRNVRLSQASAADLAEYMQSLAANALSSSSQARKLSSLRQFFRFLYADGLRTDDPTGILESPKRTRPLPRTMRIAEVDRLLDQAAREAGQVDARQFHRIRMHALVELLYATGMRVSELVSLPVRVLRQEGRFLMIRGKGNKERLVPLSRTAIAATRLYAEWKERDELQRAIRDSGPFLFPSSGKEGHLPRQVFARDLKDLAARASVPASVLSPHVIRHAFATHLLANGADLRIVQELLGHSDISTTQIYTHVQEERLHEVVQTYHPLAKQAKNKD